MNHWQNKPFVRIIIPFILGIWVATHAAMYALATCILIIVIALLIWHKFSVFDRSKGLRNLLFLCLIGFIGYGLSYFHEERLLPNHYSRFDHIEHITGNITNIKQKDTWDQWTVQITAIETQDGVWQNATGKMQLFVKYDQRAFQISDLISFEGKMQNIQSTKNPLEFDYQHFSYLHQIYHIAFLAEKEISLQNRPNFTIRQWAYRSQQKLSGYLDELIPSDVQARIAKALILGERSQLDANIVQIFKQTGAMHILAVSGLHVGIVYLLLSFIFSWIPQKIPLLKFIRLLIILVGIWAFALISGLSMAVVRAAVMFSFISIGIQWFRQSNMYNTLALSAFILLLHNPYSLFDVGFQLSYSAMLSILFFYPKVQVLFHSKHKVILYLWQLFAVGLSAQIITLPFLAYYFHQYSIGFILSNIIVMPFAFLILTLGWTGLMLFKLLPLLAQNIGFILQGILGLMYEILNMISQLTYLQIDKIYLSKLDFTIWACMLLFIISSIYYKSIKHCFISLSLFTLLQLNMGIRQVNNHNATSYTLFDAKKPLIAFQTGQSIYQYAHAKLKEKQINRITQNAYIARGIQQIKPIECNRIFSIGDESKQYKFIIIDRNVQFLEDIDLAILINIEWDVFPNLFCNALPGEIIYINTTKTAIHTGQIRDFCAALGISFKIHHGYLERAISFQKQLL